MDRLTPREREIVRLLAAGRTQVQIADLLCVSVATVHTHVKNARLKSDSRTTTELAVRALTETHSQ